MLDRAFIGMHFPERVVDVEKGRLRFFAQAIGETEAIYTDEAAARAAGYRSLPAPPTFAYCLQTEGSDATGLPRLMKFDVRKMLHAEQEFEYHDAICAGDHLTLQSFIADIYDKKAGALEFIVLQTTITNQHQVHVGTLRSVMVIRHEK